MSTPGAPVERDPRVAAWLEVEPLDEVTRARLVRTALAGSAAEGAGAAAGSGFARRVLAVAAALLVVLVAGVAVLVPRSDEGPTRTALDAPARPEGPEAARAPGSDREGGPGSSDSSSSSGATALPDTTPPPLTDLFALGDVSSAQALRSATERFATRESRSVGTLPPDCAVAAARALGTPIAAGTGTVDAAPATVVVVERPDGRRAAIAVVDATCAIGPTATLS